MAVSLQIGHSMGARVMLAISTIGNVYRLEREWSHYGFHPQSGVTPRARTLGEHEQAAFVACLTYLRENFDSTDKPSKLVDFLFAANEFSSMYQTARTEFATDDEHETTQGYGPEMPPLPVPRDFLVLETDVYCSAQRFLARIMSADMDDAEHQTASAEDVVTN